MGIRFDGLSTGLDTTGLINSLINLERRPLVLLQNRQAGLQQQRDLFQQLNTHLLALRDAASAIDNQNSLLTGSTLDEEFLAYAATSSAEAFVTASADGQATPGSFAVRVDAIAQVARRFSDGFASATDVVATSGQSLSIDFGGALPIDLTIPAAGASLNDLRDLINSDPNNVGDVRADVIFDGTAHRLIVAGTRTGAANDITITTDIAGPAGGGSPFLDATLAQAATDSQIQALGMTITRASNTLTDVIPGVTFELRGVHDVADPDAIIDVARDDEPMVESLQALVDAYNEVRNFTSAQSNFNEETGTAGPLSGDFTIRGIQRRLPDVLSSQYAFGTNPFTSLGELGVRFDRDGLLTLDTDVLEGALDTDPQAVRQLLSGDGITDGVATALARALDPITESGTGAIASRDAGLEEQIEALDATIERTERRLVQREELLIRQFTRLETLVGQLNAQGNFLSTAFAALQNSQQQR
jgi:flagellar hook-associated protein 2